MYDLCNKVYVGGSIQFMRDTHEIKALAEIVDNSLLKDQKVIVIADRGYESYNAFAHIEQKGWNYLIRVKDIESNITNLDPGAFGMEQIKQIYHMRWGIETSFRELKHTLGLASLH